VIPVSLTQEPANFELVVRQPGLSFLKNSGNVLLPGSKLKPFWRKSLPDLYNSYNRICAYLGIYLENVGEVTVDHFIPKAICNSKAYEWDNYRLSSGAVNSKKGVKQGILDPFKIKDGWFHLELLTGKIFPSSLLSNKLRTDVSNTIEKLGLDSSKFRSIRVRHFQCCINGYISVDYLKTTSPFVYFEAARQKLI